MLRKFGTICSISLFLVLRLASASQSPWIIRATCGTALVNPKDANRVIEGENAAAAAIGFNEFSLPQVASLWGPDLFVGYQLSPLWDFGISYSSFTSEIAAAGTETTTGAQLSETISGGYQTIALRSHYYFYRQEQLLLRFGTSLGIGLFDFSDVLTVDTTSGNATLGTTTYSGRASLGLDFLISPNLGFSLDTGYAFAASGALKVQSQSNMGLTVGQIPKWNGKNAEVDFSGPFFLASLTFRLKGPQQPSTTDGLMTSPSSQATPAAAETRAPASLTTTNDDLERKLNQLKDLKGKGLLNEEEYQQGRKKLLDQLVQ